MKLYKTPILAQISVAHMVSHVHFMVIPALVPLLPAALGVSYTEIGIAIGVFNVVSALIQTPMGFATDRHGPYVVLKAGLAVGSAALLSFAFLASYSWLLVVAALTGAANGVYHPADYAILSRTTQEASIGRAFSLHSFSGFVGSAITPGLLTAITAYWNIRAAFVVAGAMGVIALLLLLVSHPGDEFTPKKEEKKDKPASAANIFALPILMLVLLFIFMSLVSTALERFSVATFMQGFGISLPMANAALTAYLACSAFGVLLGGLLADRTKHHGFVAMAAFGLGILIVGAITLYGPPAFIVIPAWGVMGFLTGVIVPSRDMLIRKVAPAGAEGKTFGIVFTGFNIGGAIGPICMGYLIDHAMPKAVFGSAIAFMVGIVLITWLQEKNYFRK